MAADSWSCVSGASKGHQSTPQSGYHACGGFEEMDGEEEDSQLDFACPFCAEIFDIVGLCCHIDDEHPVEAKHWRRQLHRGSFCSHSTPSLLRKDLRDGNLQSFAPCNAAPDPLLSSFFFNFHVVDPSKDTQPESTEENMVIKVSDDKLLESSHSPTVGRRPPHRRTVRPHRRGRQQYSPRRRNPNFLSQSHCPFRISPPYRSAPITVARPTSITGGSAHRCPFSASLIARLYQRASLQFLVQQKHIEKLDLGYEENKVEKKKTRKGERTP
ncbi:hypothetical protein Cni_G03399 [Canna indica]|uniref:Drought induced 19 protein type zinc-binding domain-containing protein n=1 Tax=Canna indica TaxID=4628 RepID=A0AAQ3JTE6_9LILI|nr:hypothetical protein Cni_G03399 [Canna indica]